MKFTIGMKNRSLRFSMITALTIAALFLISATVLHKPESDSSADATGVVDGTDHFASMRVNQNTGTIIPADELRSLQHRMKSGSSVQNMNWVVAGPDNFGGRTRTILIDSRAQGDPVIYAASASGGILKSTNVGISWSFVPGASHINNVTAMVMANDGVMYVGTGEAFDTHRFNNFPGFAGSGVFKSTDGVNFTLLPSTQPTLNDTTHAWTYINKLAVDPQNSQRVFAATRSGLWHSPDGGVTWQIAQSHGTNLTGIAHDVDIANGGFTVAAVGAEAFFSTTGAPDAFDTLSSVLNPNLLPERDVARIELAISPSNPSYLYASVVRGMPTTLLGQLLGVYQSRDSGATWRLIGPGGSVNFQVFGADNVGTYAHTLVVDPNNHKKIYIGGKNLWRGEELAETGFFAWGNPITSGLILNANHHIYVPFPGRPNVLLAGTDRGVFYVTLEEGSGTAVAINRNYQTLQCYSLSVNAINQRLIGTQGNAIVYISGTGNTVDRGVRFPIGFNGAATAMSIVDHEFLVYAGPSAATGEIPIFRSPDGGVTEATTRFIPFIDPTVTSPVPIFNNPGVFLTPQLHWESFDFGQHSRDSVNFIAIDSAYKAGSEVWVRSATSRYPFRYTLPVAMDVGDTLRVKDPIASRFFMAVRGAVWMTKEALNFAKELEWFRIGIFPPTPSVIPSSVDISADGNTLWVGTRRGQLYRITNLNNAYNAATATAGLPTSVVVSELITTFTNRFVTSIAVDPSNPNHIIVTLGNYGNDVYVYRSTNAMASAPTFVSAQGNLPLMPVFTSLIEMNNPNKVFLGTDRGVYVTNDIANANWQPADDGMGSVPVTVLLQQRHNRPTISIPIDAFGNYDTYLGTINYGKIYAATFGRGIFNSDMYVGIPSLPGQDKIAKVHLHVFPNPANQIVNARFDLPGRAKTQVSILDLSGRIVRSNNPVVLEAGSHQIPIDIGGLATGVYIVRLEAGNQLLTNKLVVR